MTATVPSMIGQFNMSNIQILQRLGYEVDVACDFNDRSVWTTRRVEQFKIELNKLHVGCFQVDYSRSPLHISKHIKSYQQLNGLVKERGYDFIHCHTPVASVISRIVAHKNRVKIIYTAHGFHFYDGAPLKNWIIFYPIEKLFSRWTDVLITINKEDYRFAKRNMHAKKTVYIPGVGVDVEKFQNIVCDRALERKELGINENDFLILSVGELNQNKNHEVIIKAIALLKNSKIHYCIAGIGDNSEYLKKLAGELNVNLHLVGYRSDIPELLKSADLFAFPSYREGLPVALMEAMAAGVPCVVSNIRGNVDLIQNNQGGILFEPEQISEVKAAIENLVINPQKREAMGNINFTNIKKYSQKKVDNQMKHIYGLECQ